MKNQLVKPAQSKRISHSDKKASVALRKAKKGKRNLWIVKEL